MKIASITLGCKVNQYETQAMERALEQRGHSLCALDASPDAVIINTCAVTAESGRKSRQAVRRAKSTAPDAVIAVCGCFSQLSPDETAALGADLVFGSGERMRFVSELER
ncbi:MAG: tRNA (N(6)-L-threonylcarbamoyladenosine(37)-C(2))-methylthiotransferase MtaB, partial [Oscillospiraceae bacterium]|nr:tRNA (N(6)-L-threonylcarbamoyladenosine(37)-C(2))-methylthiotransferase MtaB [Oscillospiraceae bacterium]